MDLFLIILLIVVGIVCIVKGGDWFVDAASWFAEVSGIPQFIIGATIVSLATTLPEVLVSTIAAIDGSVEMAIGNAIGSVNANTGLIMAISIIFLPHTIKRRDYIIKGLLMVVAILTLYLLSSAGNINTGLSLIILVFLVFFIIENIISLRRTTIPSLYDNSKLININEKISGKRKVSSKELIKYIVLFILGAIGIVLGAQLLVDNGIILAHIAGVPESVIAVTLVAIGTSLPELVTTIVAIKKKKSELSIGNIIGANIIDITLIIPLCALISGASLPIPTQSFMIDMPFCLLIGCIAIIPSLIFKKFTRIQGFLLLLVYGAYMAIIII